MSTWPHGAGLLRRCFLIPLFAIAVLCLSLVRPAPSLGIVTLGSDLSHEPNGSLCGAGNACTASQVSLPGRTVVSPVNGRVLTWRIAGGTSGPVAVNVRLRVIHPLGLSDLFQSSSATESVGFELLSTFTTNLPISIGDRIGVDNDNTQGANIGAYYSGISGSGGFDVFVPQPADGSTTSPYISASDSGELLLNADIYPNALFAKPKKPRAKKNGTAEIAVNVPNPGLLQVGPVSTAAAAAGSAAAPKFVKGLRQTVNAPGRVTLRLKPTKATSKKLRKNGKASGKVTVTFTPTGGSASSQAVKVKLHLG